MTNAREPTTWDVVISLAPVKLGDVAVDAWVHSVEGSGLMVDAGRRAWRLQNIEAIPPTSPNADRVDVFARLVTDDHSVDFVDPDADEALCRVLEAGVARARAALEDDGPGLDVRVVSIEAFRDLDAAATIVPTSSSLSLVLMVVTSAVLALVVLARAVR